MTISQDKKLKLLQSMNENPLRTEILIPIFRNMDEYIEVVDHHGVDENGTDIVLIEKGPWGEYRYTSIVLKATKIKNGTTSDGTAANIIQQVCPAPRVCTN
ncbi:MAG: hypothetical protein AAFQ07_18600, partial [Chloroflexota bacterium]